MKNKEVIERFLSRIPAKSSTGSLSSTGDRLYSYHTCIAEFDKMGRLWINLTKYSVTSSRHQSMLTHSMTEYYKIVYNIDRNKVHIVDRDERKM